MKSGWKTTEFWLGIVTAVAVAIWPDFPKEALATVVTYIAGRSVAKIKNGG